jgi:hypothetical protein
VCWQVATATLRGPRIDATLTMPGTDWIRLGPEGIRRQDLRAQLVTDDGELVLFRYDLALIRSSDRFLFIGRGRLTGPKAIEYELYRVL